jgi:DNA-directed RNA polymerase subunit K/omega
MKKENEVIGKEIELVKDEISNELYKTDSIFMGINIANLRYKQLREGAHSRLVDDSLKHKNTIIAVEEVKQGLIAFKFVEDPVV